MNELIKYLTNDMGLHFAGSTDVAGVFGNPGEALDFWRKVCAGEFQVGIECIAWIHLARMLGNFALVNPVVGFHGRVGFDVPNTPWEVANAALLAVLNQLILEEGRLFKVVNALNRPAYLLLHEAQVTVASLSSKLVIENQVSKGSVARARERSQQAGGMVFDILHAIKGEQVDVSDENDVARLVKMLEEAGQCVVHMPVGTDDNDSLDLRVVPDEFMDEIGRVIKGNKCFVVVECQWGMPWSVRNNPLRTNWQVRYAREQVKRLLRHGIIGR